MWGSSRGASRSARTSAASEPRERSGASGPRERACGGVRGALAPRVNRSTTDSAAARGKREHAAAAVAVAASRTTAAAATAHRSVRSRAAARRADGWRSRASPTPMAAPTSTIRSCSKTTWRQRSTPRTRARDGRRTPASARRWCAGVTPAIPIAPSMRPTIREAQHQRRCGTSAAPATRQETCRAIECDPARAADPRSRSPRAAAARAPPARRLVRSRSPIGNATFAVCVHAAYSVGSRRLQQIDIAHIVDDADNGHVIGARVSPAADRIDIQARTDRRNDWLTTAAGSVDSESARSNTRPVRTRIRMVAK